jgi:hypothetical protein
MAWPDWKVTLSCPTGCGRNGYGYVEDIGFPSKSAQNIFSIVLNMRKRLVWLKKMNIELCGARRQSRLNIAGITLHKPTSTTMFKSASLLNTYPIVFAFPCPTPNAELEAPASSGCSR